MFVSLSGLLAVVVCVVRDAHIIAWRNAIVKHCAMLSAFCIKHGAMLCEILTWRNAGG